MPKATLTLVDTPEGAVQALFAYEGDYNNESRAHLTAALLDQHLAVIMERQTEKTPVNLVDEGGHLALAPEPN